MVPLNTCTQILTCTVILFVALPATVFTDLQLESDGVSRNNIECRDLPDSHTETAALRSALVKYNINSTWLNTVRDKDKWIWIDGSPGGEHTGPRGRHRKRHQGGCALLNVWEGRLEAFDCLLPGVTAICQAKSCDVCKGVSWCQQRVGSCYYTVNANSWFHARNLCSEKRNSTLVVLKDDINIKWISQALLSSEHFYRIGNYFWVGLHREDWKDQNGNGRSITTPLFHRVKNAFRPPRGRCLVATLLQNKLRWKVVNCSEKHPVLCNYERRQDTSILSSVNLAEKSQEEQNASHVEPVPEPISSYADGRISSLMLLSLPIILVTLCA